MTIYQRPDEKILAESSKQGEVKDFPDISRGWGVAFDKTGGIPPMEWFNALGKRTDEAFRYLLQRGIAEWSKTEDYPTGALVSHNQGVWLAEKNSKGVEPKTNTLWKETALTIEQVRKLIPVNSVNGKTGNVVLNAGDVGALKQGDFGLGSAKINIGEGSIDDTTRGTGFYLASPRSVGERPYNYSYFIHIKDTDVAAAQLGIRLDSNNMSLRIARNGVWTEWNEFITAYDIANYLPKMAVLYPQGTKDNPMIIGLNTRVIVDNPFPGHCVICMVEVKFKDKWGAPGFIYSSGGHGTAAYQYDDDKIIVQSGNIQVLNKPYNTGSPHAIADLTSAPFRVKVWKVT
ncbi:hypothetical protein [Pragia fontium]|uniref:hypothetical protein n=1 Tax=Pragia fontium TaxID=82985 RepID=UPI00064A44AB|nr:hypothetical protein [Pragia fontium]AKJ42818.1 hypothetical protein QQ39_12620 [Pragia fontium]